ncbi:MAG: hypothetical protein N3D17_01390 [bacterium]|nr:hypothetical protein [bacterium]
MEKVKYHLRFQIIPNKNVKADTRALLEFCLKHRIEEVVLFFAGEEWNNGLLSKKEEDMWFETVRTAKELLEEKGIKVSLNPWMTVLPADRGRRFPPDRRFKPMVSPYGEKSKATASFADKNWQEYIYNLYARFSSLGFRVIWIEDDFRYHNHSPLTWGGGFEKEIIERFNKKIRKEVNREEILKNVLKPGSPHPWRGKWMEVWREVQLEVASKITEAVKKNAKETTCMGLMSSHPSFHSIEGRRWYDLFNILTIENKVVHRPHFAPYCECLGKDKVYSIMMLSIQKKLRPAYCEVEPEIENFSFTTWNKSDTQTWTDMALAMFFGSDALLLNLFPFVGNRVDEEKGIGELLDRSYKSLSWISNKFSKEANLFGVGIPWKEDAAERVKTEKGTSLDGLVVDPLPGWKFLLSLGIPASPDRQKVNLIFGNNAWTFEEDEIKEMLKGGMLLDGESARILCKRGFEKYIGVKYLKTVSREESTYSLEVVKNRKSGVREGIYNTVNLLPEFNIFIPLEDTIIWTEVITPEKKILGPGITLYQNSLGGRVAVVTYEPIFYGGFNFYRQIVVQNIIKYLYKENIPFPMILNGPYLFPMFFHSEDGDKLVVLNGHTDSMNVKIEIPWNKVPSTTTFLQPLKNPYDDKLLKEKDGKKCFYKNSLLLPYMGYLVVEFKEK